MNHITLYRHPLSGHSHRAQLLLSLLNIEAEIVDVDVLEGEHKQPEFLQKNIFGQVPVLQDGDAVIADSNAILVYLASKYDQKRSWFPEEPAIAAEVQRFLSVAAGQLAAGPSAARLVTVFGANLDHQRAIDAAHELLAVLDEHLDGRQWLAADHATIADLANYVYIAHAPEGHVDISKYPNVIAWLQRVEALPGFVAMKATNVDQAV